MLGAFLLGVLTKRANQIGVMSGMALSLAFMLWIKLYTSIAWTWYVLMGTAVCFSVGYAVSLFKGATSPGEAAEDLRDLPGLN